MEPVLRPCVQGGFKRKCIGCTTACVELGPCDNCGAEANEPCADYCDYQETAQSAKAE